MPRKYQKVSECPLKLETIIELVNLLPDDAEKVFDEYNGRTKIYRDGVIIRDTAKEILNEKIVIYCLDEERNFVEAANDLLKAKKLFLVFSEMSKNYLSLPKNKRTSSPELGLLIYKFFGSEHQDREFPALIGFSGVFIKPVQSELLEFFKENDVPFYRIRLCPICQDIFWAKKTNSETCGKKKCSDELGNRKRLAEAKMLKEKHYNHFQSRVKK
jgi:hypothetical protein